MFSSSALECPAGFYCPEGSGTPTTCPSGTYCPTGSAAPTPCPSGSYCPVIAAAPVLCPLNQYCIASSATPQWCPVGEASTNLGAAICDPVPAGYVQVIADGGSESVSACGQGYFCLGGATAAEQCPIGTYAATMGLSSCSDAPAGSYVPVRGQAAVQQCPRGTYQPSVGAGSCLQAQAGYYVSSLGSDHESPCAPGSYQSQPGSQSCGQVRPGSYAPGYANSRATPCPAGTNQILGGKSSCVAKPVVSAISVRQGSHLGHSTLVISGANFSTVIAVFFGGSQHRALTVKVNATGTSLRVVVPPGKKGSSARVQVETQGGLSPTASSLSYHYR